MEYEKRKSLCLNARHILSSWHREYDIVSKEKKTESLLKTKKLDFSVNNIYIAIII